MRLMLEHLDESAPLAVDDDPVGVGGRGVVLAACDPAGDLLGVGRPTRMKRPVLARQESRERDCVVGPHPLVCDLHWRNLTRRGVPVRRERGPPGFQSAASLPRDIDEVL